jgi:hypothetical protein
MVELQTANYLTACFFVLIIPWDKEKWNIASQRFHVSILKFQCDLLESHSCKIDSWDANPRPQEAQILVLHPH